MIDPKVAWSAVLAGTGTDQVNGIAVDAGGSSYLVGQIAGANWPASATAYQKTLSAGTDAYVAKVNAAGSALTYATYLGAAGTDVGRGIAVDATGAAYVTGYTSAAFPTTAGAFKTAWTSSNDVFVTKLKTDGTGLVYSTLLGAAGDDQGYAIALDPDGDAYVTGRTSSAAPAFYTNGAAGAALTGTDAFVTKLNPTGTALVWSSYLGGNGTDQGLGIAVDSTQRVIVVGTTSGTTNTFPKFNQLQDCKTGIEGIIARFCSREPCIPQAPRRRSPTRSVAPTPRAA